MVDFTTRSATADDASAIANVFSPSFRLSRFSKQAAAFNEEKVPDIHYRGQRSA